MYKLAHIPAPLDWLTKLYSLPNELQQPGMRPVLLSVLAILRRFDADRTFLTLPCSELRPQNPCTLPREIHVERGSILPSSSKKKGRPTKNDKARRMKANIQETEAW